MFDIYKHGIKKSGVQPRFKMFSTTADMYNFIVYICDKHRIDDIL